MYALRSQLVQPTKSKSKSSSTADPLPIVRAQVRLRYGKKKQTRMCTMLLDSGASHSICKYSLVKKCKLDLDKSTSWSTTNGSFSTTHTCDLKFTMPELSTTSQIDWRFHVTKQPMGYDFIVGRDLLRELGIVLNFRHSYIQWDDVQFPMGMASDVNNPSNANNASELLSSSHPFVQESELLQTDVERMKTILDAKYEAADLAYVCSQCTHLSSSEQQSLLSLLNKYKSLFDGTLGTWKNTTLDIELKEGATPYHAKPYPIPRAYEATLKMEVERLCKIGVLKKVNRSEWAAPTFIIPKKDQTVRFISDFRELNKRLKRKPYPIPKIQDLLLKLEGFQYATSLDLNMGYYHIELTKMSKRLCTIVLPFGKYEYQRLPMGLCNSPDIFQEKMSDLMAGLEFVRTYIDDLLVITKGDFSDHLSKLERVFRRLKESNLKVNATKSFFARPELEYLGYWIIRSGVQPLPKKVKSIMQLAPPTSKREL